jgi:hypothetical protein
MADNKLKTIRLTYYRMKVDKTEIFGITPNGDRIHLKNIHVKELRETGVIRSGAMLPTDYEIDYYEGSANG